MENFYVTGDMIRQLREKKQLTQKQLADQICVCDKTISKWETNRGLPDISLLEPLAKALGVSVAELLSCQYIQNNNRSGNLLRSMFYVCPVCGNVLWSVGEGAFSCCGINLQPLTLEEPGVEHSIQVEQIEDEWFVSLDHPMTKSHYISFMALVTGDRVQLVRLYPEQDAQSRLNMCGHGWIYCYCNHHGLFRVRV